MDRLLKYNRKYNQKEYVEYLLNNPSMISDSQNYFTNLRLLTIYLREEKEMKPKQRKEFVYDFVKQNDAFYNEVTDYVQIDKALNAGKKGKLKKAKAIKVYRKEFDYINNLDLDITRRKVIFTAFCFAKLRDLLYPTFSGSPYISKKVVSVAKIKSSSKSKDDIRYYFNELQKRYFDWTAYGDTSVILPFIEDVPKCDEEDDDYCIITNFDNLYLYYDYFLGDKSISFCKICGSAFRDKNYKKAGARQRYCKECSEKEKADIGKFIVCENCGKTVMVTNFIRREHNLCEECYENMRKKDRHKDRNK